MFKASTVLAVLLASAVSTTAQRNNANYDQFNYGKTDTSLNNDYGPEDWDKVRCNDLNECAGWPDSFDPNIGWELEENHCRWCPLNSGNKCGKHHQSPINLERNRAIQGHALQNDCIDVHWMAYFDSTCDFDILQKANAFVIDRHALKVIQPIEHLGNDEYQLACKNDVGRRWGRIDFSKGFSQWWHLSHIDFHVPSEHTQEGKQYDGEIHLYHWYSVDASVAGIHNEMASVTIFLEAYDDAEDYPELNKLICQWRQAEEETRKECGMPSITGSYPGCFYYKRGHKDSQSNDRKRLQGNRKNKEVDVAVEEESEDDEPMPTRRRPWSAHDVIMHNHMQMNNASHTPKSIVMSDEDFEPADPDFDWEAFIASQYASEQNGRELVDYSHVPWFNYFPMTGVRTEYYYRYSGTQTVPPCYGKWFQNNKRRQTNHWRVMKDPIRVSQRQINEMHRLLKMRIAPKDDPLRSCKRDTAAKQDPNNSKKISVARPLQTTRATHFKVFCECDNWRSKWREDRDWCQMDKEERFYDHPYNFDTDGF